MNVDMSPITKSICPYVLYTTVPFDMTTSSTYLYIQKGNADQKKPKAARLRSEGPGLSPKSRPECRKAFKNNLSFQLLCNKSRILYTCI